MAWTPLLARWLTPTEGTALGNTLWLTSLTLLIATGMTWHRARNGAGFRFDRLDIAVCVFCGVHVVAALSVIATEGHKRAATNMLWEWTAIAVQFLLLRATLIGPLRAALLRATVALWIALAGFGVWQHFVWYPATVQEYEQARNELDALESGQSSLTGVERQRRERELQTTLIEQGIPLSGPGRLQFEGRLKDSADPVGFFALTNTFAGCLAMIIALLWGVVLSRWRSRPALLAALACIALAGWCLLLTKSRTAMCGAVAGLVLTTLLHQLQSRTDAQIRRIILAAVAIPLVVGSLLAAIVLSGAIDSDVFSDAPKSLQYRFHYWSATTRVILDHPVLGTGPGNFRDAYLIHKAAESSEEILDPHSFVLDVTANAGLLGLTALGFLLWLMVLTVGRTITSPEDESTQAEDGNRWLAPAVIVSAGIVTSGWTWLIENHLDLQVKSVCVSAAILAVLLNGRAKQALPACGIAGGLAAELVHLLGAGGIAMPAVTGVVLALVALLTPRAAAIETKADDASEPIPVAGMVSLLVVTVMFLACVWTAFLPVLSAQAGLQRGDYEVVSRADMLSARRSYEVAGRNDSLSPEPYLRLASLTLEQFQATDHKDVLMESIDFIEQALERSPRSASIRREAGRRYRALGEAARSADDPEAAEHFRGAAEWYDQALQRYPTNSLWTAEAADVLLLAGEPAQAIATAQRALELDDINREQSHADRILPDDVRERLEGLLSFDP